MEDYEKLGVFYLGQTYDMDRKQPKGELLLYDSKDLVTHAVCVGMTGSGKTGLCISLIEEAAIDGIPALLIDPKGDLCNLLLTFPQLRGEDFLPWINQDDARQKGLSPQDYAAQQANLWKDGLAKWGESGERIQRLRDAAEFRIYTPASSAGFQVSILKTFAAPEPAILEDMDLLRDRINTTVSSLLALVGIEADPVQSREHILLSTILDAAWRKGQDLDLAGLIQQVQSPPVTRIGVLDLESFYPAKERFGLVLALNNLLASPGFNAWLEGEPLDIGQMLYTPQGKPRVAIFSIAHLGDAERMFFVSLLMNQVLGWMRSQSGTTSLRALVYMDEIFGFLPPLANPPSKLPMLTLLKQARAFGVGLVLATQNPVDLDYKALSNAGTWFIGRLQTERDKQRLLDGLEGASTASGAAFDRGEIEKLISGLGSRVFLMNNTHEDEPVVFQTRWALSYLRGPLTRDQIKILTDPLRTATETGVTPAAASHVAVAPSASLAGAVSSAAPTLPPEVQRFFVPVRGRAPEGSQMVYQPRLLGSARVRFSDVKKGVDLDQAAVFLTPITDAPIPVDWEQADAVTLDPAELEKSGETGAGYVSLPAAAAQARSYTEWTRDFAAWLYRTQSLDLLSSPSLKEVSKPGESERDFRIRLTQAAREQRDEMAETLRKKYAPKIAALQERIRRAQAAVEREKEQARQQQAQAAISIGATLLGAFTGRKITSASTLGKATTAMRGISRSAQQSGDVGRATDTVEALNQQLAALQADFEQASADLSTRIDPQTEGLDTLTIRPKKTDIDVQLCTLVWVPAWQDAQGRTTLAI
jgi:hypothetical protein